MGKHASGRTVMFEDQGYAGGGYNHNNEDNVMDDQMKWQGKDASSHFGQGMEVGSMNGESTSKVSGAGDGRLNRNNWENIMDGDVRRLRTARVHAQPQPHIVLPRDRESWKFRRRRRRQ